jgi:hypothetical protein
VDGRSAVLDRVHVDRQVSLRGYTPSHTVRRKVPSLQELA